MKICYKIFIILTILSIKIYAIDIEDMSDITHITKEKNNHTTEYEAFIDEYTSIKAIKWHAGPFVGMTMVFRTHYIRQWIHLPKYLS